MDLTEPTNSEKKRTPKKKFLVTASIVLAIVLLVGGVWFWKQIELTEQVDKNADLSSTNKQLTDKQKDLLKRVEFTDDKNTALTEKVTSLEKANKLLQNPVQATLSIATSSATRSKETYNEANFVLLYIDLSVKNMSKVDGYFSSQELQLKDSSNRIHPLCENSVIAYICQSGLVVPNGKVELKSASLRAGETTNGTVGFYVPKSVSSFTLRYNGQEVQVKVS